MPDCASRQRRSWIELAKTLFLDSRSTKTKRPRGGRFNLVTQSKQIRLRVGAGTDRFMGMYTKEQLGCQRWTCDTAQTHPRVAIRACGGDVYIFLEQTNKPLKGTRLPPPFWSSTYTNSHRRKDGIKNKLKPVGLNSVLHSTILFIPVQATIYL